MLATEEYGVTPFSDGQYHFRIYEDGDTLLIQDMGSWSGTYVDDKPLPGFVQGKGSNPLELPPRSQIRAGSADLVIETNASGNGVNDERVARQIKRLLSKGVYLTSRKRYDDAVASYDKVLSWDPSNHFAWYLKSLAYAGKGEPDMSKHAMEMAKWFHGEQGKRESKVPDDMFIGLPENETPGDEPALDIPEAPKEDEPDAPPPAETPETPEMAVETTGLFDFDFGSEYSDPGEPEEPKVQSGNSAFLAIYSDKRDGEDMPVENIPDRIEALEDESVLIKEVGLDIRAVSILIGPIRRKYDDGDLDGAKKDLEKAEDTLEVLRTVQLKDVAAEYLLKVQMLLAKMKESGIELIHERKTLEDVVGAFRQGDYLKACQLCLRTEEELREVRENARAKEDAISLLKEVRNIVKKSVLDEDRLEPIKEMIQDAAMCLQNEDYREARRIAEDVRSTLDDMIFEVKLRNLENLMETVRAQLEKAKIMSLDVETMETSIASTAGLLEERKLDEANAILESVRGSLSKMVYREVRQSREERLMEAKKSLHDLREGSGKDFTDLSGIIESATTALEEDDYVRCDELLASFFPGAKRHEKIYRVKSYKEELKNVRKRIAPLKAMEFDVVRFEDMLADIDTAIEKEDLDTVGQGMSRVVDEISGMNDNEVKTRAKKLFPATRELIMEVEEAGGGVRREKEMLRAALDAFRKKDFIETCRLCMEARQEPENIQKNLLEKDEALYVLGEVGTMIRNSIVPEISMVPVEEMIKKAALNVKKEDYERAKEFALEARTRLRDLLEKANRSKYGTLHSDISAQIAKAKGLEADVKDYTERLRGIEKLWEEGSSEAAIVQLTSLKDLLAKVTYRRFHEAREKAVNKASEEFVELRTATDREYTDLADSLKRAKAALEKREYEKVDGYLEEFQMFKEMYERKAFIRGYAERASLLRKKLEGFQQLGYDISEGLALLLSDEEIRRTEDLERAKESLDSVSTYIEKMNSGEVKAKAKKLLPRTKALLDEVKRAGGDVKEPRELLLNALGSFRGKDHLSAAYYCTRASSILTERKEGLEARSNAVSIINNVKVSMKASPLPESSLVLVKDVLGQARRGLKEGRYGEALSRARDAEEKYNALILRTRQETAVRSLGELKAFMDEVGRMGIATEKASIEVVEIERLMSEGRQESGMKRAEKLKKLLSERFYMEVHVSRERRIAKAREDLARLHSETGRDFEDLTSSTELADEALSQRNYDRTDVYLEEFYMFHDEYVRRYRRRIYGERAGKADEQIGFLMGIGVATGKADKLRDDFREQLEKEKYDGAEKGLKRLESHLKGIIAGEVRSIAQELFMEIKKIMDEVEKGGGDAGTFRAPLKNARNTYEENRFIETYRLCQDVKAGLGDVLAELRVREEEQRCIQTRQRELKVLLDEVKKKSVEGAELGLDMRTVRELRDLSRRFYEEGKLEDAKRYANEARERLSAMIRERLTEKLAERLGTLNSAMEEARRAEVDIGEEMEERGRCGEPEKEGNIRECIALYEKLEERLNKKMMIHRKGVRFVRIVKAERDLKALEKEIGESLREPPYYLRMAKRENEAGRFDAADSYMSKFEKVTEDARIGHFRNRYAQDLAKMVDSLNRLEDLGFDVKEPREICRGATDRLRTNDFEPVREAVSKLRNVLQEIKGSKAEVKVRKIMEEGMNLLSELKDLGIDIEKGKTLLAEAQNRVDKWDYLGGIDRALEARTSLTGSKEQHYTRLFSVTQTEMAAMQEEAEKMELDISSLNETIEKARARYGKGDFEEAYKLMLAANTRLHADMETALADEINVMNETVQKALKRAKRDDLDVEEELIRVGRSRELEREEKPWLVLRELKAIHTLLTIKITAHARDGNRERAKRAIESLKVLESEAGMEFEGLRQKAGTILRLADKGEVDEFSTSMNDFKDLKREFEKKFLLGKYTASVDTLDNEAGRIEAVGIGMAPARQALELARENLAALDFDAVRRSLVLVSKVAAQAREVKAKDEAKREFASTLKLYGLLTKTGIKLADEKTMLEEVMLTIKKNDYLTGLERLRSLKTALLKLREDYFKEKAEGYIGEDERLVEKAGTMGLDVSELKAKIERSRTLMEVNRNRDAMVLALDCRDKLRKAFEYRTRNELDGAVRKLDEALKEAEDRGIETEEVRGALNALREERSSRDHREMMRELDVLSRRIKGRIEEQRLRMYEIRMKNLSAMGGSADDGNHRDRPPSPGGTPVTLGYGDGGSVTWKADDAGAPAAGSSTASTLLMRLKGIGTNEDGTVDPRDMVSNILRNTTGDERREMVELADDYIRGGQFRKAAILYEELGEKELSKQAMEMAGDAGEECRDVGEIGDVGENEDMVEDEEEVSSLLFLTPEQRTTFKKVNRKDIEVVRMMLDGNVFRRVKGGRYAVFSKGITNNLEMLVSELRSNNPDLDTEEMVEEMERLFL